MKVILKKSIIMQSYQLYYDYSNPQFSDQVRDDIRLTDIRFAEFYLCFGN